MLVEFQRVAMSQVQPQEGFAGEDDGLPAVAAEATPLPLAVNPVLVAAVTPSGQIPNTTIIKLADGRGYAVRGSFREVMDQLEAGGIAARQPH